MLPDRLNLSVDWDKLKTFYFVAKIGSFNAAAEYLHVSQSSLSRAIQILEKRLETNLFFRVPRGLVLTTKGQIVFEWVSQLYVSLETVKERLQTESHELKGSLKIATTNALASAWLVYYLPSFVKTHELIDISVIGDDGELDLTLGEADVLIRPYLKNQFGFKQIFLMNWQLKLYASPSYIEKYGLPKTDQDLKNHHLLSFGERISVPYEDVNWLLSVGLPEGERHNPRFNINSSHGLLKAAEDGLGIVSFSQESPLLKQSTLVPILPELKGPKVGIYYIYPQEYEDLQKIQLLLTYLQKTIGPNHE